MANQTFTTTNQYIKFSITSVENSYSIANNTSSVTAYVDIWRTNGYESYGTGWIALNIDGTVHSLTITSDMKITSTSRRFITITQTVPHNTDGSKAITVKADFNIPGIVSGSGSLSHTLTKIPRASTPTLSVSTQALDSSITIYTNRASSSFNHHLYYSWYNSGMVGISGSVGDSYTWTIPASLADHIPNATSGWGTLYLYTFSGDTLIGLKTVTFTATIPDTTAYQPTISTATYTEATDGLDTKFGAFIQGHSKLALAMSAARAHGSTISGYEMKADGQTISSASGTTKALSGSGSLAITYKATDSRGRSVSQTSTINVLPYTSPTASIEVKRTNAQGEEDDQGNYALCTVTTAITPLDNRNDKAVKIKYRQIGTTNWDKIDITPTSGYSLENYTHLIGDISVDYGYEFEVEAKDYFGAGTGISMLPTAYTTMDFRATGKGVAFGKVSNDDTFDVSMPFRIEDPDTQGKITFPVPEKATIDGISIFDILYPVGSIYMSVTNAPPSFGTWEAWGSGRVPVGVNTSDSDFSTVEKTGGANTHTHGLTSAAAMIGSDLGKANTLAFVAYSGGTKTGTTYTITGSNVTPQASRSHNTALTGNTDSASSLQPYITCYMFKRTK